MKLCKFIGYLFLVLTITLLSVKEIKLTRSFNLANDILVEKVSKVLVPRVTINELKRNK